MRRKQHRLLKLERMKRNSRDIDEEMALEKEFAEELIQTDQRKSKERQSKKDKPPKLSEEERDEWLKSFLSEVRSAIAERDKNQ